MELNRRNLLQGAAAGGALSLLGGEARAAHHEKAPLKKGAVVLFQGDSITDAGRDKRNQVANHARALGRGYPALIGGALLGMHPELELQVHNRGNSGNKVPDLAKRWEQDCLALEPDLLSILIGVNDMWHKMGGKYDGTVEDYENGYRALLERTMKALPKTRIVICEPFALRRGAVKESWFPEFDQRRAAARKLAAELKLTWVPFQEMFDKAAGPVGTEFWAGDGVHPTPPGHALMAATWLKVVGT